MRRLLEVLEAAEREHRGGIPRLKIAEMLVLQADLKDLPAISQHRITSRLTDLKYLGLVTCEPGAWGQNVHGEVRYRTKPLWRITADGREFLADGRLKAPANIPMESVPDSLPG